MNTIKKINTLLFYIPKTKLAKLLDISPNTLYKYIRLEKWKNYQLEKINRWYLQIEEMKAKINCEIESIYFSDGKMIIEFKSKPL